MAVTKKTKTSASKTAPKSTASKTTTASKAAAPKAAAAAPAKVEAAAAEAPAATENSVESAQTLIDTKRALIAEKWKQIASLQAEIRAEEKLIDKVVAKELKAYNKVLKKKETRKNATREPKGIAEARMLSNELAAFIKRPQGTKMTSSAVTSLVNDYIKANNLNDKNDKTIVYPDDKLRTLLGVEKGTAVVSVGSKNKVNGAGVHIQTALAKHFQSNSAA